MFLDEYSGTAKLMYIADASLCFTFMSFECMADFPDLLCYNNSGFRSDFYRYAYHNEADEKEG